MANELTWTKIHDEREALLADLETLTDEQWHTTSLCSQWTVQQLVAHMVSSSTFSKIGFVKGLVEARGSVETLEKRALTRYASGTPQETLAAFRDNMHTHKAPPVPVQGVLGEVVIHCEDIRRPLGITHEYPVETLRAVADFYKNNNLILGSRKRIEGVHLMATDFEWSHGEGEIVEGPMIALLMTMCGRPAFLDDLGGEGLPAYAARLKK